MTTVATHPNSVAEKLTGRSYVSFSALSTYRQCPLRYAFRYIEGRPEEVVPSSLVFGGAIHAAIEQHFNELMAGSSAPSLDTLLAAFWDSWRGAGEEATIQFAKSEDLGTVTQLAQRVLAAFQQSDAAEAEGRILGVEEELRGELVPGVPDLLARIDLLTMTDEALVVTDFKTARSRWSSDHADEAGEQLLLYGELARRLTPDKPVAGADSLRVPANQKNKCPGDG